VTELLPQGLAGIEAQLWLWLVMMVRPGAAFIVAPIFSARTLPLQIRLILSLAIGMAASGRVAIVLPPEGLGSLAGIVLICGEVLAGAMIGFAVQIGYAGALVAGEVIAGAMGLGFASMVDPAGGGSTPILSSLLSIIALLLFLGADGHLQLIRIIVESYGTLPPGSGMPSDDAIQRLAQFGGQAFSAGLLIALPVLTAVIFVQITMGVLARTAPQMNLFAVGFPVAIFTGLVLMAMAMPILGDAIAHAINQGLDLASAVADTTPDAR
jgi:flagellar biosynthetic protein FliR